MQITCPECRFTREVDETKIPARSQVATCPKCQTKFKFRDLPEEDFLIEEPEQAAAPKPAAEPEPAARQATAPRIKTRTPPVIGSGLRPPAPPHPERAEEPEDKTFPDLPDPDKGNGDELWQRLHTMTPPDKPRTVRDEPRDEAEDGRYGDPFGESRDERQGSARDQQPVPGWTGEFNEDFPDPMQDEFLNDDEDEAPMQVPPPFEQLDRYGFFHGLFLTLKLVLFSPRLFFSVMPVGNGLSKPLTFAILVSLIQTVAQYAWGVVGLTPGVDVSGQGFQAVPYDATNGLFELLLTPAFVALSLFVIAGFYHAILSVLKAGDKGFEGSFRAVAYAYAPMMTGIIPLFTVEFMAGWMFLYALWGLVLTAIGLKYIHKTTYGKVIPVLLLPLLLGMIMALLMLKGQMPTV
ncbi:MJ0042 family finger-like protein [Pseudodesulfovibrio mercurii]|uniref:MJ0042 family finger-like protein n=1 Tax=Pseudodesulfovibrio mercurii TaxID=641491 RepID=F0JL64_9BACT|nr:YIP1 family protein [Pseudodesulfovibrio mercurii]EGB16663.1 MJ0042 family finger-like protein [Pseudodesulfovibrio mercurii]